MPTKGMKTFSIEVPPELYNEIMKVKNQFKPPFYKKHVGAAALYLYLKLSDDERHEACQNAYIEYFNPISTHKIDEFKDNKLKEELEATKAQLAELQAILTGETPKPKGKVSPEIQAKFDQMRKKMAAKLAEHKAKEKRSKKKKA